MIYKWSQLALKWLSNQYVYALHLQILRINLSKIKSFICFKTKKSWNLLNNQIIIWNLKEIADFSLLYEFRALLTISYSKLSDLLHYSYLCCFNASSNYTKDYQLILFGWIKFTIHQASSAWIKSFLKEFWISWHSPKNSPYQFPQQIVCIRSLKLECGMTNWKWSRLFTRLPQGFKHGYMGPFYTFLLNDGFLDLS